MDAVKGLYDPSMSAASKDVTIELDVPRGLSRAEYEQSIIDYWTPERMASAQPMQPAMINRSHRDESGHDQVNEHSETILAHSTQGISSRSTVPSTSGKAFFVMNGQNYLCSGSVVTATNQDTVITAGHCVYDADRKIWASNWVFVPRYAGTIRPFGTFVWRRMATKQGWTDNQDFNYDVAIVLVKRNENGQQIQYLTGGLGLKLNPPKNAFTNAFGYPKNINQGETMSTCAGNSSAPTFIKDFYGLQLACDMTGGASGGPWIQEYDSNTLSGYQVSVNSFIYSTKPNNIFGPHFTEDNIGSLYQTYQDQ